MSLNKQNEKNTGAKCNEVTKQKSGMKKAIFDLCFIVCYIAIMAIVFKYVYDYAVNYFIPWPSLIALVFFGLVLGMFFSKDQLINVFKTKQGVLHINWMYLIICLLTILYSILKLFWVIPWEWTHYTSLHISEIYFMPLLIGFFLPKSFRRE